MDPFPLHITRELHRTSRKLSAAGVDKGGFVPRYYGFGERVDPSLPQFQPFLAQFERDEFHRRGIVLEYLEGAENLNCVNYTETLNILLEYLACPGGPGRGTGDRLTWVYFDVATMFDGENPRPEQRAYSEYEIPLLGGLGELLKEYQAEGLPPNTKF
ncbi:hypothetical protein BDW69DRAFT_191126 [Aspergillus filifer]